MEKIKLFQVDDTDIASKSSVDTVDTYAKIYDLDGGMFGLPSAGATVKMFICVRDFSLPTNLAGSIGKAGVASQDTAIFSIQKNGTQFATLTFATSDEGTFNGTETLFESGDVFSVIAPATQDATLSDVFFTIVGTLD